MSVAPITHSTAGPSEPQRTSSSVDLVTAIAVLMIRYQSALSSTERASKKELERSYKDQTNGLTTTMHWKTGLLTGATAIGGIAGAVFQSWKAAPGVETMNTGAQLANSLAGSFIDPNIKKQETAIGLKNQELQSAFGAGEKFSELAQRLHEAGLHHLSSAARSG